MTKKSTSTTRDCVFRGKMIICDQYPCSRSCVCGNVNPDIALGQSEWDCPCCGAHLLRDHNAAINIKLEGLRNVV